MIVSAEGIPRDPELSGGEEVRMCNPCVPDPNNEPPPQRRGDQVEEEEEGATTGPTRASLSRRNRDAYVIDQLDENSGARVEQVGPVYMGGGDVSVYITLFYTLSCTSFYVPSRIASIFTLLSLNSLNPLEMARVNSPQPRTKPHNRARIR